MAHRGCRAALRVGWASCDHTVRSEQCILACLLIKTQHPGSQCFRFSPLSTSRETLSGSYCIFRADEAAVI